MKRYNPSDIEPKWQKIWAKDGRYHASDTSDKPKYYVTGMFPYPSGAGMHAGHFMEHSIVDGVARFRRALGYNVMYPMGFDNFGLPAENYAIKTGVSPQQATHDNIANFKNQLTRVGASIDWNREVWTSDPKYYKWTQWIFTQLFERGLAYQKEANQWWCDIDKTVLANEQVVNGKCWRHDGPDDPPVTKKKIKQWFFKITDYADALLEEIPALNWPDKIKTAQENWIGRSKGAEVVFELASQDIASSLAPDSRSSTITYNSSSVSPSPSTASGYQTQEGNVTITVFTTRPDTLFGATFLVLAPEHPLAKELATDETRTTVETYITEALKKSEIERSSEGKEKTGVFTGSYAVNPVNDEKVPIWVADYVLGGYGTGAIMAVPAHDERDYEFAKKFSLPIIEVIEKPADSEETCYHGDGHLKNSMQFDGIASAEARELIVQHLEREGKATEKVNYKMRDWLISRQRYWGAPIPIVHCPQHGAVAVPEKDLPVLLPDVEDFVPKGDGKSPLARQTDWVTTTCPTCGKPAQRETDVMDGYACSSWYLLRYTDPHNDKEAWDPKLADYWTPLDMYVGGDHAVAHLLYVRFWNHVFYDMGLVPTKEPVGQLVYHGLIQAEDGRKMSKSLGNVVDPLEVIDAGYGADALRTFELFLGPINENSNWSSRGIAGVHRFLNRLWTLVQEYDESDKTATTDVKKLESITNATIKKVTDDIYRLSFNTAIAALMECVNDLYKLKVDGFSSDWQSSVESLIKLVQPFAPHMAAELWQQLGHETQLDFEPWPDYDDTKIVVDGLTIVLQVNGKVRANVVVPTDTTKDELEKLALENERVKEHLSGKTPVRIVVVPGRLVNVVV